VTNSLIEPLTSSVPGIRSTSWATRLVWGDVRDLNPQPPGSQPGALAD
jgi:hypothetical protein